jgi:hypothetical protein
MGPVIMSPETEKPQPRGFVCPHCESPALATPHGIATWPGWDTSKPQGPPEGMPTEYTLVQCDNCAKISVQGREDYGQGFLSNDYFIAYPEPRRLSFQIPRSLRLEYDEARTCFSAKAYTAAVVMVRRALEGTCKENGIQGNTLFKGLEELKKNGLIDDTLAEWANALRLVGNQGAHYTGSLMSREDAEDALAFLEALLDHIYVLRKRFQTFASRRDAKTP